MKKFTFRLDSLLNIKKQLEENTIYELNKQRKKLDIENKILLDKEVKLHDTIEKVNVENNNKVIPQRMVEYGHFIIRLKDDIKHQKENVKEEEKRVDIIRERLIQVMGERKMLEKLKEKKYKEYHKEEERNNQSILEELCLPR